MTTSPHLRKLYDSLNAEADLAALIEDQAEESLHLEFKQKVDRRDGKLGETEKRGLSKALSGFANADGGILIFGIETSKRQDGVDRAIALKPITGFMHFRARLLDAILNSTQPVVDSVEIDTIPSNDPDAGYVKILVPSSDRPPHRAIASDHHYFRRIATGHRRMEHYELEDVFGRRLRPAIRMLAELKQRPNGDMHEDLSFLMINEGRGLAKHVGFFCTFEANTQIVGTHGNGLQNVTALNNGNPTVTYINDHNVMQANGIVTNVGSAIILRPDRAALLTLNAKWYAEQMETRSGKAILQLGAVFEFVSGSKTIDA
jgi:hypothetical protein